MKRRTCFVVYSVLKYTFAVVLTCCRICLSVFYCLICDIKIISNQCTMETKKNLQRNGNQWIFCHLI